MNLHSIFFKLNALFLIALLAATAAGLSTMMHIRKKEQTQMLIKSRLLIREQRTLHIRPVKLAKELGLITLSLDRSRQIFKQIRKYPQKSRLKPLNFGASHVISHNGYFYLWIHTKRFNMLLRQRQSLRQSMMIPLSIFGGMMVLLAVIYWLIRRSLLPIKTLQKDIVRYGEGIFPDRPILSDKKDEIAEVANAFYTSAKRVQRLTHSRQLFVRNIFHELNTPVTKGKILTELVDEPKTKGVLESIFGRLASLLKELAQMEQITSQDTVLHTKQVRVIELIDQARDLLYIDEPVETNIVDETIDVDFPMMSIVFKNLIDNARKYGKDLRIIWHKGSIDFVSTGEAMRHSLEYYIEPFSSGDSRVNDGFGLGLYIVHEIAKKHGYKLQYHYDNGQNIFTLAKPTSH